MVMKNRCRASDAERTSLIVAMDVRARSGSRSAITPRTWGDSALGSPEARITSVIPARGSCASGAMTCILVSRPSEV
jgi:hypothetical protein